MKHPAWKSGYCNPASINLFKVKNRNTRKRCGICLKITIKTPTRHQWRRSDVFTINFEHISHLFLMFLFLILNKHMFARKGWRRRYAEGWSYMLIQWQCFLRKLRLLKAVQLDFHVFINYILYILFYWFHMFYWT